MGATQEKQGLIFNIQRYSIHDGPGIRTLIFMKGCPLKCLWCSNPEGISGRMDIICKENKCLRCGACQKACTRNAINDDFTIDRNLCDNCGECAKYCPSDAKAVCGEWKTVEQIVKIAQRDAPFYKGSGGGVTIGGGEILNQPEFVCEVLKRCQELGINTAIETCGFGEWKWLDRITDYCDTVLFDLKEFDVDKHKELTGQSNDIILSNLQALAAKLSALGESKTKLIVRMPLVEGLNDSCEDIERAGRFIKTELAHCDEVEILPFHNLGEQKYVQLGKSYTFAGRGNSKGGAFDAQAQMLAALGIKVRVATW